MRSLKEQIKEIKELGWYGDDHEMEQIKIYEIYKCSVTQFRNGENFITSNPAISNMKLLKSEIEFGWDKKIRDFNEIIRVCNHGKILWENPDYRRPKRNKYIYCECNHPLPIYPTVIDKAGYSWKCCNCLNWHSSQTLIRRWQKEKTARARKERRIAKSNQKLDKWSE